MKLIGVLLLSAFLISNVAADQLTTRKPTHMGQDLEKRSCLGNGDCPDGFVYFGYCYKFVFATKTWIDAELHCRTLAPEGHLASIHWQEQSHFIRKNSSPLKKFWTGLNDICKEGTFLWTDGSSSDFMNWKMNQPDNHNDKEHCVHSVVIIDVSFGLNPANNFKEVFSADWLHNVPVLQDEILLQNGSN
ncbi:C-type lectin Cal-like [Chiloscyllium punctatum]|uniref:C-type lectin Cal-like n=1 Tax=Chiloscyllium punctatum TaxID=137246 RepID=UPI003B63CF91